MRRGFLAGRVGRSWVTPWALARQKSAAGHSSHNGAPLGRQTVAPRSIMAWLNWPGKSTGMMACRAWVKWRLPWVVVMSVSSARTRAATRNKFPSTAGTGWPKQMEAMAAAV